MIMLKYNSLLLLLIAVVSVKAQNLLTPEQLWKFGRVSGKGISKDGKFVVYNVSTPNVEADKSSSKLYVIPVSGGNAVWVPSADSLLVNTKISADGKYKINSEDVKVKNFYVSDDLISDHSALVLEFELG